MNKTRWCWMVLVLAGCMLVGCQDGQDFSWPWEKTPAKSPAETAKSPADSTKSEQESQPQPVPPPAADAKTPKEAKPSMTESANPKVVLETTKGNMTLELYPDKAPKTVENFLTYVDDGFYNGTIFHRVIPGFMIQGGGFTSEMQQKKTRETIPNEAANGLKNQKGTIAMARTPDPHSASSQFFINVADNDFLNFQDATEQGYGYCVFGQVVDGMDVAEKIVKVKTGRHGPHGDVPTEPIAIEKAYRLQSE